MKEEEKIRRVKISHSSLVKLKLYSIAADLSRNEVIKHILLDKAVLDSISNLEKEVSLNFALSEKDWNFVIKKAKKYKLTLPDYIDSRIQWKLRSISTQLGSANT